MKELHGSASADVAAPPERCLAMLADVERYPAWHPDVVRRVEVVERHGDGSPAVALADLHAPNVPVLGDFSLRLAVEVAEPGTVTLSRIAHGPDDRERFTVRWHVRALPQGTALQLRLEAELSVPRLVPVGALGNTLAQGFISAAERALDGA